MSMLCSTIKTYFLENKAYKMLMYLFVPLPCLQVRGIKQCDMYALSNTLDSMTGAKDF